MKQRIRRFFRPLKPFIDPFVRPLIPVQERYVVVRARTTVTVMDYLISLSILLMGILAVVMYASLLLAALFGGILGKLLLIWQQQWMLFFLQFVNVKAQGGKLAVLDASALLVLVLLGSSLFVRRWFREIRRLIAYTRTGKLDPFLLQNIMFLRYTPVSWLWTEMLPNPSPGDALKAVPGPVDTWKKDLEQFLQENPPQTSPLASLEIVLTHQLVLVLVGQNGRSASLIVKNKRHAALIAYLACQPQGAWTRRKILIRDLYGSEEGPHFGMDVARINQDINQEAQRYGLTRPDETGPDEGREHIQLLENRRVVNDYSWRLTSICTVKRFDQLQSLSKRVTDEYEQKKDIDLAARRRELMQLVQDYGAEKGLLGTYQTLQDAWPWLTEPYRLFRSQWLSLLTNTAELELAHVHETPDRAQDIQALQNAARFYAWAVQATSGIFSSLSLDEDGEAYLVECLRCYRLLHDFENARAIAQEYIQRRHARDGRWEPRQRTKDEWPEVIEAALKKPQEKTSQKSTGKK